MQPACVSNETIQSIIEEIESSEFHCEIRDDLRIETVEYRVEQGTYLDYEPGVKARSFIGQYQPQVSHVERIIFYIDAIRDLVNQNFSKLTKDGVIQEVARTTVKFLFAHELKHVQQFEQGLTMECYRQINYTDNYYENEANIYAKRRVGIVGDFQQEIVNILCNSRYQMIEGEHTRLMNVYGQQYQS